MGRDNSIDLHISPDNEQEYVDRIQNGDTRAFKAVVLTYYSELCNFSWHFLKSQTAAEDIVQDVLANVWELRKDWNPGGTVQSYLYRAVKNRALNYIQHQETEEKYIQLFQDEKENITPPKRFDESEHMERIVREAIDELPDRAQMVYKLHRRDGFTYNEIAYIMDISPKTVESQMSRALQFLRDKLHLYLPLLIFFSLVNKFFH